MICDISFEVLHLDQLSGIWKEANAGGAKFYAYLTITKL